MNARRLAFSVTSVTSPRDVIAVAVMVGSLLALLSKRQGSSCLTHVGRESAAIGAAGADVLFLPPYSPDFNPIEKAWAKLKDILRRVPPLTRDAFDAAVAYAMDCISTADVSA